MPDNLLQGWNAISEFLVCDVRTAKRWEQGRHLPVHRTRRTPGQGRANVYALVSELQAWLASANPAPTPPPHPSPTSAATPTPTATPAPAAIAPPPATHRWQKSLAPLTTLALTLGALTLFAAGTRFAAKETFANPNHLTAIPKNTPAPELYLHGSYLFEQRTPETLQQAQADFQSVIAANPNYAPAYAGLAKTYALLREYANLPAATAYPLVRQAAQHAIALDPRFADAHTALAYEEFFWEWDAPHAELEFRHALALDPNSSLAHHWYGSMLMHQRRFAEAIDQLSQAQVLQPDSASTLGSRAYAIGLSGHRSQAANLEQDILTRVPNSAPLHFTLAQLCLQQPRDIPRYLDQMRQYATLRHSPQLLAVLDAGASAYRSHGEPALWQSMLHAERRLHPDARHPTYFLAELEALQGLNDDALRDLNLLLRNHDEQMIGIEIDTTLSSLWTDPRFASIATQVGLPPAHAPA